MRPTGSTSRSPRASRPLLAGLAACACLLPHDVPAQAGTPVLTIDQERLLAETRLLAASALAGLERDAQALAAENLRIANELIAEERALTDRREALPPEEFRDLADAFHARVQELRAEQDEKGRLLERATEEARRSFVLDVISDIARARGAFVVIDRRNVILSAPAVDITDEAIRRINEASGDEEE